MEAFDSAEPEAAACAAAARLLGTPAYAVSYSVLLGDVAFQRRRLARLLAV